MLDRIRTVGLATVAIIVLVAAGCAARYGLVDAQLQRDTIPGVRAEAEQVRALATSLGFAEASRFEMRGWFDPFCQLYAIPANRVSEVTTYRLPDGASGTDPLNRYYRALEQRGWTFDRPDEGGLSVGWWDRYRLQTTATSGAGETSTMLVEVRNESRTADGCFK
jgi:hypothetical protein